MTDVYVHDLNPVLVQLTETLAVRWYGLAYIGGFVVAYFLLKYLSKKEMYPVPQDKLADFITLMAIFGVMIGGRLGYMVFYQIPREGIDRFLADWTSVFRVWEGGMASHGGIIGVILFVLYYARKHRMSFLSLSDGVAIVAPVGIFFGRIANFINGELYGRIAPTDSSLAMKFPSEMLEGDFPPEQLFPMLVRVQNELGGEIPGTSLYHKLQWVIERVRDDETVKDIVGEYLSSRYPSQLFEAMAEGLLLFAVLWWVRMRFPRAPHGLFCALFCFLYALGRIATECFRQPDAPLTWGITRGQFLSVFLVLGGILFLIPVLREIKRRRAEKQ